MEKPSKLPQTKAPIEEEKYDEYEDEFEEEAPSVKPKIAKPMPVAVIAPAPKPVRTTKKLKAPKPKKIDPKDLLREYSPHPAE